MQAEDSDKDYQELYEDEPLHDDEEDDHRNKYPGERSKQKHSILFSLDEMNLSKI